MFNPALLALEASDASVVITCITLVFGMLVALCLIITLEGKIFDRMNGQNAPPKPKADKPTAPAPAAPAKAKSAPAAAPKIEGGIPGEVIAAIAAAVSTLGGNLQVHGVRRAAKAKTGTRRGAWGDAGVGQNTRPFM